MWVHSLVARGCVKAGAHMFCSDAPRRDPLADWDMPKLEELNARALDEPSLVLSKVGR